jgi:hypothetical protein
MYTAKDRDAILKRVERVTVTIAALSITAASAFFMGADIQAKHDIQPVPINVTVQAPPVTVNVPAAKTVVVTKTVSKPVVLAAPKKKAVTTTGGS